eukprot:COSAG06_NODE_4845_length_3911_cov_2.956978_1_plen_70_part_10
MPTRDLCGAAMPTRDLCGAASKCGPIFGVHLDLTTHTIAHYIHCPDAATPPFAPTRRRRAPKSATEGGME